MCKIISLGDRYQERYSCIQIYQSLRIGLGCIISKINKPIFLHWVSHWVDGGSRWLIGGSRWVDWGVALGTLAFWDGNLLKLIMRKSHYQAERTHSRSGGI